MTTQRQVWDVLGTSLHWVLGDGCYLKMMKQGQGYVGGCGKTIQHLREAELYECCAR